jgi:antitoxin VapB
LNIATTRAFKSGDSQAIIIPAELAYDDMSVELSITRHGDVIVVAPARPSMKDLVADLRAVPKPSSIEVREPIELPDPRVELTADFVRVPGLEIENWMIAI